MAEMVGADLDRLKVLGRRVAMAGDRFDSIGAGISLLVSRSHSCDADFDHLDDQGQRRLSGPLHAAATGAHDSASFARQAELLDQPIVSVAGG